MNPLLCVHYLTLSIVKQANTHKELGHKEQKISLPSTARSSKRLLLLLLLYLRAELAQSVLQMGYGLEAGSTVLWFDIIIIIISSSSNSSSSSSSSSIM